MAKIATIEVELKSMDVFKETVGLLKEIIDSLNEDQQKIYLDKLDKIINKKRVKL
jgi:hypothetical protein